MQSNLHFETNWRVSLIGLFCKKQIREGSDDMYGIIREGNKQYYITRILGFYNDSEDPDLGRYFIVLDRNKKKIQKVYLYNPEVKPHLDLRVLLLDNDTDDWILDEHEFGCVDFLSEVNLPEMVSHNIIDRDVIDKCVAYDKPSTFKEVNEILSEKDAEIFMDITGELHDARIVELEKIDDNSLRVLFDGIWGCDVELYFEGDVSYCTDSRDPMEYDPYWGDSQVAIQDGFITFYDDAYTDVSEINDNWCWFRARKMSYKIIPL